MRHIKPLALTVCGQTPPILLVSFLLAAASALVGSQGLAGGFAAFAQEFSGFAEGGFAEGGGNPYASPYGNPYSGFAEGGSGRNSFGNSACNSVAIRCCS